MEFNITKFEIDSCLSVIRQITSKKNEDISLSSVKIKASIMPESGKGLIEFSAFNGENGIIARAFTEVIEDGYVTVNAKRLLDIVKSMDDGSIKFKLSQAGLFYQMGRIKGRLNAIVDEVVPELKTLEWADISVSSKSFLSALTMSVISASKQGSGNSLLESIHLYYENNTLNVESADGYRLSRCKIDAFPLHEDTVPDVIIPAPMFSLIKTTITNLIDHFGDNGQQIFLSFPMEGVSTRFTIDFGRATLFLSVIDGKYPSANILTYEQAITTTIECSTYDIYRSAVVSEIFARDNYMSVLLKIDKNSEEPVLMMSESQSQGSSKVSVENVDIIDDNPIEITLNVAYLIHALKVVRSDGVKIGFINRESPVFLRPLADKHGQRTHFVPGEDADLQKIQSATEGSIQDNNRDLSDTDVDNNTNNTAPDISGLVKEFIYVMMPQNRSAVFSEIEDTVPHYLREDD